jgi:hypothetical protein
VVLIAAVLSGCATGPRPTLVDRPVVRDPAIAAVLDRLDRAEDATFTAEYTIVTKYGGATTTAVVTQDGERRSTTIGTVRFIIDAAGSRTCDTVTGACATGIDDAAVSDTQLTHQFWYRATANRLRTDAERDIAPASASLYEVAGATATCVAVPVIGGVKSYCALDSGVLAGYDGADLTIDLTDYSPEADSRLFAASGT